MYVVSAILGWVVYLLAFGISLMELRSKVAFEETFSIIYFIKNIRKDTLFTKRVLTIIVAALPLIAVIVTYRWIAVDTVREVDSLFDSIY